MSWELNGDDGLSPAEWDFDEDADWETADDSAPYVCHGYEQDGKRCAWEGEIYDLTVEEDANV